MKLSGRPAASSRQSELFNRKLVHQSFEICLRILSSRSAKNGGNAVVGVYREKTGPVTVRRSDTASEPSGM